ncbi:hypothetical protein QFC22_002950 [Naganishia vaughanmartiniae]|uniref:Uncharacterized protein n=1 Tax=Naganishia vaughanmartiniae TaxID=1424756 RepID=A0ACC2X7R1_9TREE|nr:hypothetical protein QFC22_002950 [Naganishia vaughanmartiniae]
MSPSTRTVPCPILKLAASLDILTLANGTQSLVFDVTTGKQLPSSSPAADEKITSDGAAVKARACKLVATGYAPVEGEGKEKGDVQPVVASITEDKVLRLVQADTGAVFYERTLIKKASYVTVEDDGTVVVSDKNGDVFAYPFVNDANTTTTSTKPRPDPVALAGDPSLNPDATLLVGHVSIVTAHAYTRDKKWLVTVDRDEHVRLNRARETHVIDKFLWGHKDFVSTIATSPLNPHIIHTAGGDPYILTSHLVTGQTVSKLAIAGAVKPFRSVRAPLRKVKRRVNGQRQPGALPPSGEGEAGAEGQLQSVRELPVRGLSEDVWNRTPDGWGLPEGEGICVGKMEVVGEALVFFSEGTSAIHSVPASALESQQTATPETIKSFETPYPVLDFCVLPSTTSDAGAAHRVLLALDPGWRYRVDGGGAWFPPKNVVVSRAGKRKGASASATATAGQEGKAERQAEGVAEEVKVKADDVKVDAAKADEVKADESAGLTDDDINEMSRDVLMVLQLGPDGQFTDVTAAHRAFIEGIQNALQRVKPEIATQLPAYNNLAFLPKWASPEGADDDDFNPSSFTPESIEQLQAKAASSKKGANAKRQIGRLKAQGIAVEVPRTEEQKVKRADANRERKKRKKEQRKGGPGDAQETSGEAGGAAGPVEVVQQMDVGEAT